MKQKIFCLSVLALSLTTGLLSGAKNGTVAKALRREFFRPTLRCGNGFDVAASVDKLSLKGPEAFNAIDLLVTRANESPACRTEIVERTMDEMRNSNPDILYDRPGYNTWANGASLLSDLKAIEALDLIMEHLDLHDVQFSSSMYFHPVILAVRDFGASAIPKLNFVLQHSKNPEVRRAAVVCLVDTGEQSATDAMRQALSTESDPCVRRLIELNIDDSHDEKGPFPSPDAPDTLMERIMAFRCGK